MLGLSPGSARADDTHYQDFIVGGRAVVLGGAYTAISDDPSGIYYNPAGLADAKHASMQVTTSLYGFERGSIEGHLTIPVPGVERLDIQFTDLIIVPASAGFVKTIGPDDESGEPYQAYGLSVVVPSFRSFTATAGDERRSYQRRVTDRELWTGMGYGKRFSRRLRLGVAVQYILRSVVDVEDVTVNEPLDDGSTKFQTVKNDISFINGNVLVSAGAKLQVNENLALGLAVDSPSWQAHSQAQLRFSRAAADPGATSGPTSVFENHLLSPDSETRRGPAVRLGAALSKRYKYTVAGDVSYHAPVSYTLIEADDSFKKRLPFNPRIERQGVLNFNIGGEYLVVREVSIAGGLFTDLSSAPEIPRLPSSDQPPHVNLTGLSMALGYFGEHTLSRLGVIYTFGNGYDVIPEGSDADRVLDDTQSFRRVEYFQSFFYVFVSSAFRY